MTGNPFIEAIEDGRRQSLAHECAILRHLVAVDLVPAKQALRAAGWPIRRQGGWTSFCRDLSTDALIRQRLQTYGRPSGLESDMGRPADALEPYSELWHAGRILLFADALAQALRSRNIFAVYASIRQLEGESERLAALKSPDPRDRDLARLRQQNRRHQEEADARRRARRKGGLATGGMQHHDLEPYVNVTRLRAAELREQKPSMSNAELEQQLADELIEGLKGLKPRKKGVTTRTVRRYLKGS